MGSGNTKLKKGGPRGGQKKKKEIAELHHIIKQLGFWTELEVLFYQICDRVEEIEHGWPVLEGLKKAFQAFEKQIQAKGWKRKFVSAPSYHRYQRLKNDLIQAGTKQNSNVNKPTIPKTILNKRDNNEPIQEYSVVVEKQLSQAQAEVKALKRQLDRLQGELVEFHTSRLEVDRWINKLIDQNNTILKIQTFMKPYNEDSGYDVMEEMMEEVNPLPSVPLGKKHESKDILESTHRWMEFMSEILPEYYEMKSLQSRYTKVKDAVLTFGPIPPPLTERTEYEIEDTPRGKGKKRKQMVEVPVEDEGEGLVRLLQETQERLQEQENAIMSLQEDNEFLRKKLRTGGLGPRAGEDTGAGPSGSNVIPRPTFSKHDEEERKEIMKRNPRNAEYLDVLMTQIKRQKVVTRRIDRLKMNVVKVKLHGGYDENDLAGAMTEKDDGIEFDALMVIETNNRVLEDTIPELENLLMLATVGQKLLESVDTMYTHFCSDILRDNERILAHLGEKEPEADTASNIVTKYRQKLEDIQTTLLRNRDDIVDLQKEKSGLEKKAAELRETKKAMRRLEIKAEKMSSKLVRKTGTDLVREDPDITDVVGFKKGKEKTIWERYKDAYEFEWFDAYDLEKNYLEKPPREGIDTLLHMLKDCFEYCKKEADDQWLEIKKALLWEAKIERDFTEQDTKYLLNLRKNYIGSTDVIEDHFREKGMSEEYKKEAIDDKFNPYIRKIVELCWFMVLQDPPMHLHWDIKYADFIDKDMFDNFTLNGRRYDFIVWPAMMLHKDGPLLSKGIIQPIFLD